MFVFIYIYFCCVFFIDIEIWNLKFIGGVCGTTESRQQLQQQQQDWVSRGHPVRRYRSAALTRGMGLGLFTFNCSVCSNMFYPPHTHTHTRTHLKNTTLFFFGIFFYRRKNTLGVRLTVRRVRRALIRPVTCGPIALFNLSSSGKWVVWQRPPQLQVLPPLHSPPPYPFHAYATAVIEAPNELPSAAFRTQSESHLMLSISVCTHSTLALPRFPIPSCLPV